MGVSKGTIMSRLFHARKKSSALVACYAEETNTAPSDPEP
jgi:RNA polymerase sigma-70 factor (ECF subfamily)